MPVKALVAVSCIVGRGYLLICAVGSKSFLKAFGEISVPLTGVLPVLLVV
jgi:hypothetical protein